MAVGYVYVTTECCASATYNKIIIQAILYNTYLAVSLLAIYNSDKITLCQFKLYVVNRGWLEINFVYATNSYLITIEFMVVYDDDIPYCLELQPRRLFLFSDC